MTAPNARARAQLAQELAQLLLKNGFAEDLADAMIDRFHDAVQPIECGHRPVERLSTLVAIADALEIGVGELTSELGNGRRQ